MLPSLWHQYCAWTRRQWNASHAINYVSDASGISLQLWVTFLNNLLRGNLYKFFWFIIIILFSGFQLRFYHVHHITTSYTVTDDVTNQVTHRIFNTKL